MFVLALQSKPWYRNWRCHNEQEVIYSLRELKITLGKLGLQQVILTDWWAIWQGKQGAVGVYMRQITENPGSSGRKGCLGWCWRMSWSQLAQEEGGEHERHWEAFTTSRIKKGLGIQNIQGAPVNYEEKIGNPRERSNKTKKHMNRWFRYGETWVTLWYRKRCCHSSITREMQIKTRCSPTHQNGKTLDRWPLPGSTEPGTLLSSWWESELAKPFGNASWRDLVNLG